MKQQEIHFPGTHGGARPGAGRPKIKGRRASEPHKVRAKVDPRKPLHVVLRAVRGLRLRKKGVYHAIRGALARVKWVRIIHMSIQQSHVHLIVEAQHAAFLAKGMKSFQISAAKQINAAIGRDGQVFADRYHAVTLGSPRQVRNCLAYVLRGSTRIHGVDGARPLCECAKRPTMEALTDASKWALRAVPPRTDLLLDAYDAITWASQLGQLIRTRLQV